MTEFEKQWFNIAQSKIQKEAMELYNMALSKGIAKEQARMLLPLSTKTRLYQTGNIRSWIHYLEVRCDPSTQKEHRDVANKIKEIFIKELPIISEAMGWK